MIDLNVILYVCKICHKLIVREELGNGEAVYHDKVGFVHTKHKGVKEWYNELLELKGQELNEKLERMNNNEKSNS